MVDIILAACLGIIVVYDIKQRRIPNKIVCPLIVFGMIYNLSVGGLNGLMFSLTGMLVGGLLLFIPFVFRGVGAGDVKLLAAVGSFYGMHFVLASFLYGAIIGGILSVFVLIQRGRLFTTLNGLIFHFTWPKKAMLPLKTLSAGRQWGVSYGLALVTGVFLVWYLGYPF